MLHLRSMAGGLACALILLSPGTAWLQECRGTIAGRVTDAQDAGIPGVRLVVTNVETGVCTVLETNDRGAYLAPLLIPGNYRISNDFFANRSGIARGDFNDHRRSASVSEPIVVPRLYHGGNETFFMWAYEALRDRRPRGGSINLTVPTADHRNNYPQPEP